MNYNPPLLSEPRDLFDGLNGSHFVVRVHYGDKDRFRGDFRLDVGYADQAEFIDRKVRHTKTVLFKKPADFKHRGVLDLAGDDVIPSVSILEGNAKDRMIIGFGPAAGEDDLVGITIQE